MLKFLSKLLKKRKSKEPIAKRAEVGKGKKVKDPNMLNRPPTAFVVLMDGQAHNYLAYESEEHVTTENMESRNQSDESSSSICDWEFWMF
ncbi:hypothetical protein P8452_30887 [Trifolium repens]|nr:hypothetical protein P8452_30887 [Trifolium repens]